MNYILLNGKKTMSVKVVIKMRWWCEGTKFEVGWVRVWVYKEHKKDGESENERFWPANHNKY